MPVLERRGEKKVVVKNKLILWNILIVLQKKRATLKLKLIYY